MAEKSAEQKLLDMKEKVDRAKEQESQAKGALDQLYKQLETEYGVKNLDDAESLLKDLDNEADALEKEIEQKVKDLELAHDWT